MIKKMKLFEKLFCKHEKLGVLMWIWTYLPQKNCPDSIIAKVKCEKCGKILYVSVPVDMEEQVAKFMQDCANSTAKGNVWITRRCKKDEKN